MSLYEGVDLARDAMTLTAPNPFQVESELRFSDLSGEQKTWFARAQHDDSCLYFAMNHARSLVGEIFLHDLDAAQREAMVGYHIFRSSDRSRGYGTVALGALCAHAFGTLGIHRLIAITSHDNMASRRIAVKCGFVELGAAREGPNLVALELRVDAR